MIIIWYTIRSVK